MHTSRKTLYQHFETIFDLSNQTEEEKKLLRQVSALFDMFPDLQPYFPDNRILFFIEACRGLTPQYAALMFSNLFTFYSERQGGSYNSRVIITLLGESDDENILPYSDEFHAAAQSAWLWGKRLLPFFNKQEIRNLTPDSIAKFKKDKKVSENYEKEERIDSIYFKNLNRWYGKLESVINLLQAIKVIEEQLDEYPSETIEAFHTNLSTWLDLLKHNILHYDVDSYYCSPPKMIADNILLNLIETSIALKCTLRACFNSLIATGLYEEGFIEAKQIEASITILSNQIKSISDESLPTLLDIKNHFLNHTLHILENAAKTPTDTSLITQLLKEVKQIKELEEKNGQVSKEMVKFRPQLTVVMEISLTILVLSFIPLALLGGLPLLIPIVVIFCAAAIFLATTYLAPKEVDNTISENLSKIANDLNPDFCQSSKNSFSFPFFKEWLFNSEKPTPSQPQIAGK